MNSILFNFYLANTFDPTYNPFPAIFFIDEYVALMQHPYDEIDAIYVDAETIGG